MQYNTLYIYALFESIAFVPFLCLCAKSTAGLLAVKLELINKDLCCYYYYYYYYYYGPPL
jgi:hypothetical protein